MDLQSRLVQCRLDKAAIAKQEQEILEAMKPKLRHGDYGYYHGDKNDPCVVYKEESSFRAINHRIKCDFTFSQQDIDNFVVVGNFIDDLT